MQSGSHDDEMFLDEDDFLSSDIMDHQTMTVPDDRENMIRKRRSVDHTISSHIIYKRAALQTENDYGKQSERNLFIINYNIVYISITYTRE